MNVHIRLVKVDIVYFLSLTLTIFDILLSALLSGSPSSQARGARTPGNRKC